jgi:quinoprotein glucose dehydrogenase
MCWRDLISALLVGVLLSGCLPSASSQSDVDPVADDPLPPPPDDEDPPPPPPPDDEDPPPPPPDDEDPPPPPDDEDPPPPPVAGCANENATSTSRTSQVEWRHYAADAASSKYAVVADITRDNFDQVTLLWDWCSPDQERVDDDPDLWPGMNQGTPLQVGGVLYTSTSLSQAAAIDPVTGGTHWVYDPRAYDQGSPSNLGYVNRGISYYEDGDDRFLFLATGSGRLISLDADTGRPARSFGNNGIIDLRQGLRRPVNDLHYSVTSPPLVCGDTVVVGSAITDYPVLVDPNVGDVRAFDVRTGARKWTFVTIPQPGEFGNDTWENNSWQETGGTNVWAWMSCDEELGLVYMPTSTPTNDFYGGNRPGDNLFAESIVAVDVEDGERAWSFQVVHHGLWDYDLPAAPNLIDIRVDGRNIPALAQVSKQAFTYVLDRRNGQPVWPIEERAVPGSTINGELSSPTQPIPTKPAPFDRQGVTEDDLIDFTPDLRRRALDIVARYDQGPVYSPPTRTGTITMPGLVGGASWSGAGVHPGRGMLYVPSLTKSHIVGVTSSSRFNWVGSVQSGPDGPGGLPLFKPPYGRVTAIDLNSGDHDWMAPVGEGLEDHPELAGLGLSDLGMPLRSFVLVTDSLLFVAQEGTSTRKGRSDRGNATTFFLDDYNPSLRAYDLDTGEFIGQVPLPGNATGSPMTYKVDNKQFIVIPIGGSGLPARLIAIGLP